MIVSVSGFGWSGSGAVFDLLKEYDDLKIAFDKGTDTEFGILADIDGLRDLEYHLCERCCRISSYVAILRFRNLVDSYARYMKVEKVFNGKFKTLSYEYIESLIDFEFKGSTYYELFNASPLVLKYNSFVNRYLGNRYARKIFGTFFERIQVNLKSDIRVSYKPECFLEKTRGYLTNLFNTLYGENRLPLVFDQMIPPDNPLTYMRYIDNPKCIIVRRDPRDTYLLAKCKYKNDVFIPTDDVNSFISFYKKVVEQSMIQNSDQVLSIHFEDLIYEYDKTVCDIENFLGVSIHSGKGKCFKPEVSICNTQLFNKWKEYEEDIRIIENALPDSLYPFYRYSIPCDNGYKVF